MKEHQPGKPSGDRVVFFGVIVDGWITHLRRSIAFKANDLLCLAIALENASQNLKEESSRDYENPRYQT